MLKESIFEILIKVLMSLNYKTYSLVAVFQINLLMGTFASGELIAASGMKTDHTRSRRSQISTKGAI